MTMKNDFGWLPEQRREIWEKRIKPALGEIVLDGFDIVRLVGLAEDERDFYYIYIVPHMGYVFSSCVGGYVRLKGFIDDKDYERESSIFDLNMQYWPKMDIDIIRDNSTDNMFFKEEDLS